MPVLEINGWRVEKQRATALLDGWSMDARAVSWKQFTDFHQRLRSRDNGEGDEARVELIWFRKAGEVPQDGDMGFQVNCRHRLSGRKTFYIVWSVPDARSRGLGPDHLARRQTTAQVLAGDPARGMGLPLNRWEVVDSRSARATGFGSVIQVTLETYGDSMAASAEFQGNILGGFEVTEEDLEEIRRMDDSPVFTVRIVTEGEPSRSSPILPGSARAHSIRAFCESHPPVDFFMDAAREALVAFRVLDSC